MPGTDPDRESWRAERAEAAAAHAQALERRRAKETEQARGLIAQFLAEARRRDLAPVPLRARSPDGKRHYRTGLEGWYLRRNQTVGLATDGGFYLLTTPAGPSALLRGVRLEPSDPPMVLGAGARDGESIDLAEALARVLEEH
ncbi:hypothetical protein Q6346_01915 [Isoptericola sp. b490]|uniref:hypothetical protein n=1 Tax=Actinotalea lenta TaxID=3064654 RepID=UPI0027133AC2|nr:hypothetical protein [Isoptericola sp. b490]MDO8120068.1 hypothetical protein [Isoptericola sp. b490]